MEELTDIYNEVMKENNEYGYKFLNMVQLILFITGLVVIIVLFIFGGRRLLHYLHQQLIFSKVTLSLLNIDIIVENPYFQSFVLSGIKKNGS